MSMQAAAVLKNTQSAEKMKKARIQEMEFLDIVADITSEIDLGILLQKVMSEATRMLNAERSTLFLNDEKTSELFSKLGEGIGATEIRFPNHLGIAGAVFTSGESINMPHAYADLRFNPSFDKQTGFFTRSILCVPLVNKAGKVIGVTQMLNKRGGAFTQEDESRLKAFTAQVSIALENAKLFNDVQNMKNYSESMLDSMSNGVITLDEHSSIVRCNSAALKILGFKTDEICGHTADEFFMNENAWLSEKIKKLVESQKTDLIMDAELSFGSKKLSVNVTLLPLNSANGDKLGSMIMVEDISNEKRIKQTMSRYVDPSIADQLLGQESEILGGHSTKATVLFSDIRGFTTLTEELGAQGTVKFLNDYFTRMVDCIVKEEGMLDKFIGDAIMAAFGTPVVHDDDEDRALRCGIEMIRSLWEWNDERAKMGETHRIDMGLGLNTDDIVCGNIGSQKRMNYTMIGDGVNLAARLESACKQYSARIIISEYTQRNLKGTYRIRDIDDVIVKGKTEPVRIFEVLDYHTPETFPNMMDVVGYFSEGREKYRSGDFAHAFKLFNYALNAHPDDKLCKMYVDRCNNLMLDPPADWNGVYVMTSK
jgi:adenylate cyclase